MMRDVELVRAGADAANMMYVTAGLLATAVLLFVAYKALGWVLEASLVREAQRRNVMRREEIQRKVRRRERDLAHAEFYHALNNPPFALRMVRSANEEKTEKPNVKLVA
jgi:hypothetical protein